MLARKNLIRSQEAFPSNDSSYLSDRRGLALIDSHDPPAKKAEFQKPERRKETKAALRPDEWLVLCH